MYHKENEKMSLRFVVLLDCCTQYLLTRTVMCYFTWDHKPLCSPLLSTSSLSRAEGVQIIFIF